MLFRLIPGARKKLRNKLLVLGLFPIILLMPVALALAIYWGTNFGYDQLFLKVNTDLSVAHDAFLRVQQDYLDEVSRLGESYTFRSALKVADADVIADHVRALREKAGFSYLHVTDADGYWLYEGDPGSPLQSLQSALTARAQAGEAVKGIELFTPQALAIEGLLARVILPLIPTPYAMPTERSVEDRGMMIRVLYPIIGAQKNIVAVLDGGVLLNGNFGFVDTLRDLVYGPGSLPAQSIGTVTVFLEDVRISTNVPLKEGERALGTRVSREVRDDVFGQGNVWSNLAFVVNDWYISAYEPIYDHQGQRVGMLYAGFLADPFQLRLWQAFATLVMLFFALMFLSVIIVVRGARQIFGPVEAMSRVVRDTRGGHLDRRIGAVRSEDELGELAKEFDVMLDKIEQQHQQVLLAAEQLESKVDERTRELSLRNEELQKTIKLLRATRQQLVMAEKLAALGELTAGVAHEINNPLAVMLGNMDIVLDELGQNAEPVAHEIQLVVEQIYRIQAIVSKLLLYSRPNDYAGFIEEVDVNRVVDEALMLATHIIDESLIHVHTACAATERVSLNAQELQQVLVNLIINAVHALESAGGNLYLSTRNWADRGVMIEVRDDGPGIDAEQIGKVFNAFYSTKQPGKGTGIGLSVSYGLVKRYGGNITVSSHPGAGASFRVWLLTQPHVDDDELALVERLSAMEEAG